MKVATLSRLKIRGEGYIAKAKSMSVHPGFVKRDCQRQQAMDPPVEIPSQILLDLRTLSSGSGRLCPNAKNHDK
ncbi:MAG: hypothetical protein PHO53_00465 [Actinomycetota bacterium]|nr:hypothetical protein [Actinomycetota bacterium]